MGWLDDRIDERRKLEQTEAVIDNEAPNFFRELWARISELTREATGKGLSVQTHGTNDDRAISVPASPGPRGTIRPRKEVKVALDRDRRTITVKGAVTMDFVLDVCGDEWVCLKLNGTKTSPEVAARLILDPLLVPELPRFSIPSE